MGSGGAPSVTCDAGQNLIRGFGPDEGGIFVIHINVFADSGLQFLHTAEHGAANLFVGKFCEPALDQVDPGAVGGREVDTSELAAKCVGPIGTTASTFPWQSHNDQGGAHLN